jgi:dGTPase
MHWPALFEPRRLGEAAPRDRPNRNPFQIDQDRIQFSRPFRRLQQKTQVHPLPFNAHVRNRLVHTLEVASVGRSLGYAVGTALADDLHAAGRTADDLGYLVQAACLAHDIGNPSFGHAGEEVIAAWMADWAPRQDAPLDADLVAFDGNAQGFRILARADGFRDRGGLRLTLACLAAMLKYPWDAADARAARHGRAGQKFGHFASEAQAFAEVCAATGLAGGLPRHPAVWLMEAADDITYTLVDLEDAVELGMVAYRDYAELVGPLAELAAERLAEQDSDAQRIAFLRSRAVGRMIGATRDAFLDLAGPVMAGALPPGTALVEHVAEPARAAFAAIAARNRSAIYLQPRKVEFEIGARDVLGKALEVLAPACLAFARAGGDAEALPRAEQRALSLLQDYRPKPGYDPSAAVRCAIDFVAGMTDHYAAWLAARLRGLER